MDAHIALTHLPTEILLLIFHWLTVPQILAVRQTCKTLQKVTEERAIWLHLVQTQRIYLPFSQEVRTHLSHHPYLSSYKTRHLESLVTSAERNALAWPRTRNCAPRKLEREGPGTTLMGVEMLVDRWLMVIYSEGTARLYDIQPVSSHHPLWKGHNPPLLRATLEHFSGVWTSYTVSVDCTGQKLILAVVRTMPRCWLRIYEVDLARLSAGVEVQDDAFHLLRHLTMLSHRTVRALDVSARIIVLSSSSMVELVRWEEQETIQGPDQPNQKLVITLHPEDLEDLWNGVVAVHFMGPYILIFKTRSIELHNYTSLIEPDAANHLKLPALKHFFTMTFRDATFSDCIHSHEPSTGTDTWLITLFANDVIQGIYQFTVRLTIFSHSDVPPNLEVTLVGLYSLTINEPGLLRLWHASALPDHPSSSISPSPRTTPPSHQGGSSEIASRGFVSCSRMGPQARRAIWVERKRSSTVRELQVWSQDPPWLDLGDNSSAPSLTREMERNVVYSVHSYDLRDDITHCTFSEPNGLIVLGHRSGDISILDLDV